MKTPQHQADLAAIKELIHPNKILIPWFLLGYLTCQAQEDSALAAHLHHAAKCSQGHTPWQNPPEATAAA